jgi:ATP-binding cassette, subfamily B, bacterial
LEASQLQVMNQTSRNSNPLVHLVSVAWKYTGTERFRFILYILLSAASMGVALLDPIIIGWVLNALQAGGDSNEILSKVGFYLSLYLGNAVLFWALHGPSRVIERDVAFTIRVNYQLDLFQKLVQLPIETITLVQL